MPMFRLKQSYKVGFTIKKLKKKIKLFLEKKIVLIALYQIKMLSIIG